MPNLTNTVDVRRLRSLGAELRSHYDGPRLKQSMLDTHNSRALAAIEAITLELAKIPPPGAAELTGVPEALRLLALAKATLGSVPPEVGGRVVALANTKIEEAALWLGSL